MIVHDNPMGVGVKRLPVHSRISMYPCLSAVPLSATRWGFAPAYACGLLVGQAEPQIDADEPSANEGRSELQAGGAAFLPDHSRGMGPGRTNRLRTYCRGAALFCVPVALSLRSREWFRIMARFTSR